MGFFDESLFQVAEPKPTREQCGACGLLKTCLTPKMEIQGEGRAGIMLVGNVPDIAGDGAGVVWGGDTGQRLRALVRACGLSWDRDLWVTSALACHGKANGDRARACRPLLMKRIQQLQPKMIILLGQYALQSVVGQAMDTEELGTIDEWNGFIMPMRDPLCWLAPTHDPATVKTKNGMREKFFEHHITTALQFAIEYDRPHALRDYEQDVVLEYDHQAAAAYIRGITERGRPTAIDFETNMIKPDNPAGQIHTVSICEAGEWTLATPFVGDVVAAFGEYAKSPAIKIASNMKFEDRWTWAYYGHALAGLAWDTMAMAHVIDTRKGITSIKTQGFIHYGWPLYDGHIHKFFEEGENPNAVNGIAKINLGQLLLYNGVDSALEYDVALAQMALLQHPILESMRQ